MKSKFSGKCRHCGKYFSAGTEIENRNGTWYPKDCPGCVVYDELLELERRAEKELLEHHNIGMGYFGLPEGVQSTGTRAEWAQTCVAHGVLTQDEAQRLIRNWGVIAQRDLAD